MKIALVVPSLAKGGGVPSVARFIKNVILDSGQWELKLISLSMDSRDPASLNLLQPSTWVRGPAVTEGVWEGLPFYHVGAVCGELEFQRYQKREILSELVADCDLIQVVAGAPAWANSVVDLGKPVSLQVATRAKVERRHKNGEFVGCVGLWRKGMTAITDRMDSRAVRKVNAIQVENPWMLDWVKLLTRDREADIRYAPPGIDIDVFSPAQFKIEIEPYILCVARLDDPRKRVDLLLDVYAKLPVDIQRGVRLQLAGSSPPPDAFWTKAEQLGIRNRVSYEQSPNLVDLVSLYQNASVFALPSDEEGLGMVVLESMACGVPVVSTKSGGPEGIITHGKDGFLVPREGTGEMAGFITQILCNKELSVSLGKSARLTIEQRYSRKVAGDAFLKVWSQLYECSRLIGPR